MLIIDAKAEVEIRKHAGAQLRKAGIPANLAQELESLEWDQLHEQRKALKATCRELLNKADGAAEGDASSVLWVVDKLSEYVDDLTHEIDERGALGNRGPRETHRREAPGIGSGMDDDPPAAGREVRSRVLTPEQRFADTVTRGARNHGSLTAGDYLRAMVLGARSEAEHRALTEGTDSAGGYTVPEVLSGQLIDLMRANTVAIQAGAVTVPLTTDTTHIARLASDPSPAWRGENGSITESDPTFARVTFEPKSLAVLVKVSRELLEDSLNIGTELPRILAAAMAQELDRVVFLGTGSSNEPSGLDTISGVLALAHDSTIDDYSPLVTARRNLMRENAQGISAWIMHPDTEAVFGGLADTTGQPLAYPPVLDRPTPMRWLTTTQLPTDLGTGTNETTIYAGDFTKLAIGIRSAVTVQVLRERYADTGQYGFVCHMRADVAAIQPKALLRITGVQLS